MSSKKLLLLEATEEDENHLTSCCQRAIVQLLLARRPAAVISFIRELPPTSIPSKSCCCSKSFAEDVNVQIAFRRRPAYTHQRPVCVFSLTSTLPAADNVRPDDTQLRRPVARESALHHQLHVHQLTQRPTRVCLPSFTKSNLDVQLLLTLTSSTSICLAINPASTRSAFDVQLIVQQFTYLFQRPATCCQLASTLPTSH